MYRCLENDKQQKQTNMSQDLLNNNAIRQALENFLENLPEAGVKTEPFDGVFEVEGMDHPLIIPPTTTMGELAEIIHNTEIKRQRLAELAEWLDQHTGGDAKLAAELLGLEKQRRENLDKLKTPCKLLIRDDKIGIELPDKQFKKITFGRGNVAKMLYVFCLRQIERAEADRKASPCLSRVEMGEHKEELSRIYQNISGKSCNVMDVDLWLSSNTTSDDFANAIASIRKTFDNLFDVLTLKFKCGKCYSIEIMENNRKNGPRYGIGLDTEDFDLGWYSVNKMRF